MYCEFYISKITSTLLVHRCLLFVAYIGGLATTIFVMHVYKHAQPAILYLVPACLGKHA